MTSATSQSQIPTKRLHHYLFTHRALPDIFLRDPLRRFSLIAQRNGREFLEIFWKFVGEDLEISERMPCDEVDRSIHSLNDNEWLIAVVRMPKPLAPPEAWFAALALRPPAKRGLVSKLLGRRGEDNPDRPIARYFTLETGEARDARGELEVVCAEWNRKGKRREIARALKPDEKAFVHVVADVLLAVEEPGPEETA